MHRYWKKFTVATLALFISGSYIPAFAQETTATPVFSDQQKQEIQSIVKDYLINNPSVLIEANKAVAAETERQRQIQRIETEKKLLASSTNILMGNQDGDVTIIEFFDYNCGYCRRAFSDLQTAVKDDAKLKVVIHDFPVLGERSINAARVSLAVKKQVDDAKMLTFHAKLMESQSAIDEAQAKEVAKSLGVDMTKLESDMKSPDIDAALDESRELGRAVGIEGTPAFLVAGELIPGAIGLDSIKKITTNVRECGNIYCGKIPE